MVLQQKLIISNLLQGKWQQPVGIVSVSVKASPQCFQEHDGCQTAAEGHVVLQVNESLIAQLLLLGTAIVLPE